MCTWTRVHVLQHPQECPVGAQTGRSSPRLRCSAEHRGMCGYFSGEASSSRERGWLSCWEGCGCGTGRVMVLCTGVCEERVCEQHWSGVQ